MDFTMDDVFIDEKYYTDKEFNEFLDKTKENLTKLSITSRNSSTVSFENNEDIESKNCFVEQKNELVKESKERSVPSQLMDMLHCIPSPTSRDDDDIKFENFLAAQKNELTKESGKRNDSTASSDENDDTDFENFAAEHNEESEKSAQSATSSEENEDDEFENFLTRQKNELAKHSEDKSAQSATSSEENEDNEFENFLAGQKNELAKHSEDKNASTTSIDNNEDIEFSNFLGGLKNELAKLSEEKLLLSCSPCNIPKSQNESPTKSKDPVLDEKKFLNPSLNSLHDIEKKLMENFKRNRVAAAKELFTIFNEKIFESKFPHDMELEWSVHLLTTAGLTNCSRKGNVCHSCKIELSTKVCTTFDRLRDTLLHEMCHAAVFLISQNPRENHGPLWKAWALRCNVVFPGIEIPQRCHNYDISYPFYYHCKQCDWKCGRHRKIPKAKLENCFCPKCKSALKFVKA